MSICPSAAALAFVGLALLAPSVMAGLEGTCSVCLSELVDGEKVRVLTACMHCFHARCVEKWLRENATCPLCRAPAIATAARGRRRRRRRVDPNLSSA